MGGLHVAPLNAASESPVPGDLVVTPDSRQWTVRRIMKGERTSFIAEEIGASAVFSADVHALVWDDRARCWTLVDRRQADRPRATEAR